MLTALAQALVLQKPAAVAEVEEKEQAEAEAEAEEQEEEDEGPLAKEVKVLKAANSGRQAKFEAAEVVVKQAYSECPNYDELVTALLSAPLPEVLKRCRLQPGASLAHLTSPQTTSEHVCIPAAPHHNPDSPSPPSNHTRRARQAHAGQAAGLLPGGAQAHAGPALHHGVQVRRRARAGASLPSHTTPPPPIVPPLTHPAPRTPPASQIHKLPSGEIKIFSRNSEDTTGKYPDVVAALPQAIREGTTSFVIDAEVSRMTRKGRRRRGLGERSLVPAHDVMTTRPTTQQAVAIDPKTGKLLPFQILSTRKRKAESEADIKVYIVNKSRDRACTDSPPPFVSVHVTDPALYFFSTPAGASGRVRLRRPLPQRPPRPPGDAREAPVRG